jgi:RNA polymerase sigma-70 factor (ECF subfamily)
MTTPGPSDAALLAAADPDAFRELYERYVERVFGYFVRRTGDHDASFDLTAEAFAQAWIMRRRFRDEAAGSAAPWLFGIARNVLLMSVRRGRLEQRAVQRLGVAERLDGPYDPASAAPEERWAEGADELLDALPESQREAVRLRVVDQLEYDEVALALGTSPSAARVRVHRGLAALRKETPR